MGAPKSEKPRWGRTSVLSVTARLNLRRVAGTNEALASSVPVCLSGVSMLHWMRRCASADCP